MVAPVLGMDPAPPPPPPPLLPGALDYVAYTDSGVIDRFGAMPEESFRHCQGTLGHNIILGQGRPETHYVEFVGEARAPVLRVRPQLEHSFDKTAIAVRGAATMVELPSASVTFDGPVKGRHTHEGGDLVVGWTVPGTYTVLIEAFPALPATFEIKVGAAA
ncbi:hypothetical protein D8770_08860 [Methylobacterium sp. DB1607]|nr:hypothetical protein [Methylobacterium sp. DB1607]